MERVVVAFGAKLAENPTAELVQAYINLTAALGKDGDYAAIVKRLEAAENRLSLLESGTRNVRHMPAAGMKLG